MIVVPMLLLAGLTGCAAGGGAAGEPAAPAPLPVGRTFVSTGVTSGGQPKALVDGTTIRLTIGTGNVIAVQAGCNTVSGRVRLDGSTLVATDDLAMTAIGCPANLSEQDSWLYGFFRGRPSWQLTGNDLVLTGGDLTLTLIDRAVAEPARPLVDTKWTVDTIVASGGSASSVPSGESATMTFTGDNRVSGYTGCNQFFGPVTVAGNQITFGVLGSTDRACPGAAGALEADLMKIIGSATVTYRIEGDRLILTAPDGSGLQLVG
ncbi:META domain-containing protein [Virgisporangium aurantiacum]|uniref:META domain-containing protein n=1 Tax=Virgisporangium aurantiacum TaxID=175570 RepID=A0A8J4E6X4_9ACTN|nr:META domain-containing protein [Virgisporangium aurantiacum]